MSRTAVLQDNRSLACTTSTSRTLEDDVRWKEACQEFLVSVPADMHTCVERSLRSLHEGGVGLRAWVSAIARRGAKLPECVPAELVKVYLDDPEATPLHECETCGIAIPIRPNRLRGMEDEPEETYFNACPVCGGRTGLYLYMSRQLEGDAVSAELRRIKPR
jgi:hypothetical protein